MLFAVVLLDSVSNMSGKGQQGGQQGGQAASGGGMGQAATDNRATQMNPNNQGAVDNRATQMNPNNAATKGGK